MNTDELIARLSRDVSPVSRHAVSRRLSLGLVFGALASGAAMSATLGLRPDLGAAVQGLMFWIKCTYTLSLATIAVAATAQLSRPEASRIRWLWLLALPVLVLALVGITNLLRAPRTDWLAMWLGNSWMICPWLVLALSFPILAGLLWAFRQLAPTRLRLAGGAAGLASGASAAAIYCLHCPETSALFVLTWYSLGIVLATVLGALLGPRLLRW